MAQTEFFSHDRRERQVRQTMQTTIHPTALVSEKAVLGQNVTIGAYCVIGDKVTLGDNVTLHSHVVIDGNTKLGEGVRFSPLRRLVLPSAHSL